MSEKELVKLYYRIGEVSRIVGVQPHVLRYWETEFRSIRPQKSGKGQRVYSRKDVGKLLEVKDLLRNQGFTIAGARKRLVSRPAAKLAVEEAGRAPIVDLHRGVVSPQTVGPETETSKTVDRLPLISRRPERLQAAEVAAHTDDSLEPCLWLTQYAQCVPALDLAENFGPAAAGNPTANRAARTMRRALLSLRQEMLQVLTQLESDDEAADQFTSASSAAVEQ